MNKIDAAIEAIKHGTKCGLNIFAVPLEPEEAETILEALQAMKDKECIAEQPDTIHNDDCVKHTIHDTCVRDALEAVDRINRGHSTMEDMDVIRTALLAKQPDIERLKRVEENIDD